MFDLPQEFNDPSITIDITNSKLPFPAPKLVWRNGEHSLKDIDSVDGVRKFGGWSLKKEDYLDLKEELPELPPSFKLTKLTGNDGEYENYLSRTVWFAPANRRFAWFRDEKRGSNTSLTQYVGWLAYGKDKDTLIAWGSAVLQAKSLMGVQLDQRIAEFKSLSASVRGKTLSNYFFHPLGTFGKVPTFSKSSSKNGASSTYVTNVQLYKPEPANLEVFVKMCFVGTEVAKSIFDMIKATEEWAKAWNERKDNAPVAVAEHESPVSDGEPQYVDDPFA